MPNVTIWNEGLHEQRNEAVRSIYPQGIHGAIADLLKAEPDFVLRTATLAAPEHGLPEGVLNDTDVLIWWGHLAHHLVEDAIVARVQARVLQGMGLIVLHSGHLSKIFRALMGTTCNLRWREAEDREVIWTVAPAHPIAVGVRSRWCCRCTKCMASTSTFRHRMNSSSSATSLAARSSEVAAVSSVAKDVSSTSVRDTKRIRSTTGRISAWCSPMRCDGRIALLYTLLRRAPARIRR